jgi:ribosome-associated toxin RatA of RatAB toxin-antitoxin module
MNIKKSAFVFHPQKEIFNLVDKVEDYPNYLPWCDSTSIIQRNDKSTTASIGINYKGIKHAFSTKNEKNKYKRMDIKLINGPFKYLSGAWTFKKIDNKSCHIELELEYKFSNIILEKMISPVFNIIANTFIDEFIKEADRRKNER